MTRKDRNCNKAKIWRKRVLENGQYRCKKCDSKDKLVAHHIIEWDKNESLRFEISNGEILCSSCHMIHHGSGRSNETKLKMSNSAKAVTHSIERNRKISKAKKGTRFTEEHKAKLSKAKENYKPWNIGVPMKESTKELFRKKFKGKKWIIDPETNKRRWID